jgi:hypothetical protein
MCNRDLPLSDFLEVSAEAAERLLAKIRAFIATELDEEERKLFAALIAPGIAQAYSTPEVAGFDEEPWSRPLPEALSAALRTAGVRVIGLEW